MAEFPLPSTSGQIKRVAGADPAANAEVSDTVPAAVNEQQTIAGTASGNFGIQIGGDSGPATLTPTATAADVQAYLRAFISLGADGVTAAGGPLNSTITVTFNGTRTSGQNMPPMSVTGATTGLTFATTVAGSGPKSWYLMSVSVQCVQGATQTPFPSLVIDDGTNIVFQGFCGTAAISAATTTQCTWAPGLIAVGGAATTANTGPLPASMVLSPGWRIRTVTTGIGANTNYGAPSYFICELELTMRKKTNYYRAKNSFVVTEDGIVADSVNAGEVFSPDHPYVKRYGDHLEPTEKFGRFDTGTVEQATAAPGEKRGHKPD